MAQNGAGPARGEEVRVAQDKMEGEVGGHTRGAESMRAVKRESDV